MLPIEISPLVVHTDGAVTPLSPVFNPYFFFICEFLFSGATTASLWMSFLCVNATLATQRRSRVAC